VSTMTSGNLVARPLLRQLARSQSTRAQALPWAAVLNQTTFDEQAALYVAPTPAKSSGAALLQRESLLAQAKRVADAGPTINGENGTYVNGLANGTSANGLANGTSVNGAAGNLLLLPHIELLVCDMAGTTVEENGLVYSTLRACMNDAGLSVSEQDMHPWHGAQKSEVVAHFAGREGASAAAIAELEERINGKFEQQLEAAYMAPDSVLAHIHPRLAEHFNALRARGVKIGLNTGYPRRLQGAIIEKLRMEEFVDGFVSAQDVRSGRPSPYMVHHLMEQLGVEDVRAVAKAGDTERDIGEGLNAGCSQVIGVLSGADSFEALDAAGAHAVVQSVVDVQLPTASEGARLALRLEKLRELRGLISADGYAAKEREILAEL